MDLAIANIGSLTLTSLPTPLLFTNVLHVPAMSKNLISLVALCADNLVNVLFFNSFFQVQDHYTGVTLIRGQHKDDVYYWLKSIPLQPSALVLSSLVQSSFSAISIWHSRLGHSPLHIFHKFLSVLNIYFPKNIYIPFLVTLVILIKFTSYLLQNQALPLPLFLISFFLVFRLHPFHLLMVFTTVLFLLTITQSIFGFTRYVENRMFIPPLSPSSNLLKTI